MVWGHILTLNVDEIVYIAFGNYCDNRPDKIDLKIKDKYLEREESCKYLGVIFDYNMKRNKHIEYIVNKTKDLINIFYKLSKTIPNETLQ